MICVSDFYRSIFGVKVYKISLNAGCTCPNRDGTKGWGGCIFCSTKGSGDFIFEDDSLEKQFEWGISLVKNKVKNSECLYIPYFQSFSSTYGDEASLIEKFSLAVKFPKTAGLAVATRPDCLSEKMLEGLGKISENKFIQIELGLQTSSDETGKVINRCYSCNDYENAVHNLKKKIPHVHIVTHLIFGLPGESEQDMMNSVKFVQNINRKYCGEKDFFGVKFTNLYVLKNTVLENMYLNGKFRCLEKDEYFYLLDKALDLLDERTVVHRFNGDPPKKEVVSPLWAMNKKKIISDVSKLVLKRKSCAGH